MIQFRHPVSEMMSRHNDKPRCCPRVAGSFCAFLFLAAAVIFLVVPGLALDAADSMTAGNTTRPAAVQVGVFVMDFNRFSVEDGTVETNFYLSLRSDTPVSISDVEIINGKPSSIDTLIDTPNEKYYRIHATVTSDPDLRGFPFESHIIPIIIESKMNDTGSLLFLINTNQSGLDENVDMPGWEFTTKGFAVANYSYGDGETPYSRAVFDYGIRRDSASTLLKFFLPITLIIIVSLSSLLLKVSSRLGLNASMFLAAVLIHWRISDAIPLVGYATCLDLFMIITYATLVMVLISGILIMTFTEAKDTVRVDTIHRWSLRIIPAVSISLYCLLFISIVL